MYSPELLLRCRVLCQERLGHDPSDSELERYVRFIEGFVVAAETLALQQWRAQTGHADSNRDGAHPDAKPGDSVDGSSDEPPSIYITCKE